MTRTRPTPTTRLTPNWGTSSGTNPGDDFEEPQDISDVIQLDTEISRGSRGGGRGLDFPSDTGGLGDQIPRGSRSPTGGINLLKDPPGGFEAPKKTPGGGRLPGKPAPRSPLGLEVGKSAGGALGIVVSAPIGGPISARGGINIGAGGAIKGGQVGLGLGVGPIGASIDIGTDQNEEGRGGCYQYITVTAGPFSHTYGRNVCEPKPPKEPETTLPTTPSVDRNPNDFSLGWKCPDGTSYYLEIDTVVNNQVQKKPFNEGIDIVAANYEADSKSGGPGAPTPYDPFDDDRANAHFGVNRWVKNTYNYMTYTRYHAYTTWRNRAGGQFSEWVAELQFEYTYEVYTLNDPFYINNQIGKGGQMYGYKVFLRRLSPYPSCPNGFPDPNVPNNLIAPPTNPPLSPPVPNPPPRKKMDDKCCKQSLILQVEILRLLGRELGPNGLVPQTKKPGFIGEEFERVETPIKNPSKPKTIKIRFETVYELLAYVLKQANNLDTALDPQSYEVPTGKLQNPAYNRDSEHSLKSNNQPLRDKSGNKRELEINKDEEALMGGFLQQSSYMFQMLRRFEYLFPPGELEDALIAKSLLIPGATGDIKIHNMIMAYELQMQYLDAALGNPRELLTIKDANPAVEGDQPIEVKALSISDLLRQNIKFHIDTGGDVDALINLVLRDFRTNLANRIDLIKSVEMVQALFEDSGMLEKQEYIDIHLEGDVYAGQWMKGQGFKANPDLEKKTEEATEEVLRATMKPVDQKIKVSRRSKDEKTDMRDLLRGLADFVQRLLSIPSAGDAGQAIDKLVESAKFKVQTEMALIRQNVAQAAAASRNRTKKRKK